MTEIQTISTGFQGFSAKMCIVGFFRLQPRLVATDKELWRE